MSKRETISNEDNCKRQPCLLIYLIFLLIPSGHSGGIILVLAVLVPLSFDLITVLCWLLPVLMFEVSTILLLLVPFMVCLGTFQPQLPSVQWMNEDIDVCVCVFFHGSQPQYWVEVFVYFFFFITVLQRSVHPGLPFRETAQRAGGRAEDGLRGAEKPRVVPWSNTKTGNTHTCAYTHAGLSHESLPAKAWLKLVEPDHPLLDRHSAHTVLTGRLELK